MTPALARMLARSVDRWESHPLAQEALAEVRSVVGDYVARKHEPHRWALFHERMAKSLRGAAVTRWQRFVAWGPITHHERMARRYAAHAWALDELAAANCGVVPAYRAA